MVENFIWLCVFFWFFFSFFFFWNSIEKNINRHDRLEHFENSTHQQHQQYRQQLLVAAPNTPGIFQRDQWAANQLIKNNIRLERYGKFRKFSAVYAVFFLSVHILLYLSLSWLMFDELNIKFVIHPVCNRQFFTFVSTQFQLSDNFYVNLDLNINFFIHFFFSSSAVRFSRRRSLSYSVKLLLMGFIIFFSL